ncbi:zf-HC2 domain-containing protein [Streptomyces sp. NPDC017993]|uniref:zf-HC2 domain-containing protein n=1 Tax=Streptomyces sp. NPDC017993 TaxID=3365027 RepID=UPI00379FEF7E
MRVLPSPVTVRLGENGPMHCSVSRTALSARLDGECLPEGITDQAVREHLAGCVECSHWDRQARRLRSLFQDVAEPGSGRAGDLLERLRRAGCANRPSTDTGRPDA